MKALVTELGCFIRMTEISMGAAGTGIHWHLVDVEVYQMRMLPDGGFFYDYTDLLSLSTFNMN